MNATPPARARGARGARAMDPAALERLHDACEEGDIDAARALCDADHALLTARDEDGQTCLHHACAGGDVEVVRFLVDACGPGSLGCNERDDHDMTPFHLACECGHIAVVVSDARPNGDEGAAPTRDAPAFDAPLPKRT